MGISDVVAVTITIQDSVPSEEGFGIPAIFAFGPPNSWKTYTADSDGLTALVADGSGTGTVAYKMAAAIASQNPKVETFKVYGRSNHNPATYKLTPTVLTQGYVYSFGISDGSQRATITHTNGPSETAITIATALAAAVTSAAIGSITGTHSGTDAFFTVGDTAAQMYLKDVSTGLTVLDTTTDAGIATDLAAALALDDDWFGLLVDVTDGPSITAAAAWAEANERVYLALTADGGVIASGGGDIASTVKTSNYNWTSVFYETDLESRPDCGLLGRQLSQDPGSSSFHAKKIAGTEADALSETSLTNARGKNALTYTTIKGIDMTLDGKAGSGRFLDITIGAAWLKSIIQDAILTVMANAEKVPFTNPGIATYVSAVQGAMARAEGVNFLAPGWTVTAPDVTAVNPTDKGNRILNKITFRGELAGAIHKVVVNGTATI